MFSFLYLFSRTVIVQVYEGGGETIHIYKGTIHIYGTIHVYGYYSSDVKKHYQRVVLEQ